MHRVPFRSISLCAYLVSIPFVENAADLGAKLFNTLWNDSSPYVCVSGESWRRSLSRDLLATTSVNLACAGESKTNKA